MSTISIKVNDRFYEVSCAEEQKETLQTAAQIVDRKVVRLSQDLGQIGETRLLLFAALLLAEENALLHSGDLQGKLLTLFTEEEVAEKLQAQKDGLQKSLLQQSQIQAQAREEELLLTLSERLEELAKNTKIS